MIGGGMIYGGGGDSPTQKQKLKISSRDQPFDSIFASASSNHITGSSAMVSFGAFRVNTTGNLFYRSFDQEEISGDEYLDEYLNHPEKKRRLTVDQVQFLEKSFEAENKLEADRKNQLATELGLQPRQIAIWFQNRRARSRTKQVETDFEMLSEKYNCLKSNYDTLLKENEKLKLEVFNLKENPVARGEERESSQSCVTKGPPESLMEKPVSDMISKDERSLVLAVACRNEDESDARNGSSTANGIRSSHLETGDSSQVLKPDQSEFSDNSFQLAYVVSKMDDGYCHGPAANPWIPVEDHAYSFWSY